MGQLLSIPFIVLGGVWLYFTLKQKKKAEIQL